MLSVVPCTNNYILKVCHKMILFDLEFIPLYPNNRFFPYMAAICDPNGNT